MTENINLLLFLLLVILITRVSILLKNVGIPSILGELCGGMFIALLAFYNLNFFRNIPSNSTLAFLSELGGIFLLFEIGLDSDIDVLKKNAIYTITIACVGAILPFISGYFFAKYFMPEPTLNLCLFFGAALAATSTGISVRIFKDYNLINSRACQIVLASSVIDDIISLVILTYITAIAITGNFTINNLLIIFPKIVIFFVALYVGVRKILPRIIDIDKKDNALDLTIIISICLLSSWLAHFIGLSSIIGAFLAGLFMDKTYFKEKHYLIYPFIWIFVPIFFIYSGMQINIASLMEHNTFKLALLLSIIAIITKVISPLIIKNQSSFLDKLIVGLGIAPRGEIGLIIALVGKSIGVINDYCFNIITIMVFLTSFISPILLNQVIKIVKNK